MFTSSHPTNADPTSTDGSKPRPEASKGPNLNPSGSKKAVLSAPYKRRRLSQNHTSADHRSPSTPDREKWAGYCCRRADGTVDKKSITVKESSVAGRPVEKKAIKRAGPKIPPPPSAAVQAAAALIGPTTISKRAPFTDPFLHRVKENVVVGPPSFGFSTFRLSGFNDRGHNAPPEDASSTKDDAEIRQQERDESIKTKGRAASTAASTANDTSNKENAKPGASLTDSDIAIAAKAIGEDSKLPAMPKQQQSDVAIVEAPAQQEEDYNYGGDDFGDESDDNTGGDEIANVEDVSPRSPKAPGDIKDNVSFLSFLFARLSIYSDWVGCLSVSAPVS